MELVKEANEEHNNNEENNGPSTNSSPAADSRKRTIHLEAVMYIMRPAGMFGGPLNATASTLIDLMTYLPDDVLSNSCIAGCYLKLALCWHYNELSIDEPSLFRGGPCPDYLHPHIMRAWRSVPTSYFLSHLLPIVIHTAGKICCDFSAYDDCFIHTFLMERYRLFVTCAIFTLDRLSEPDSLTEVEHRMVCERFHLAMEKGATPIAVVLANFVSRATIESCAAAMRSRHELRGQPSRHDRLEMRAIPHSLRPYCRSPIIDDAVRFLLSLRCGIGAVDPTSQLRAIVGANKNSDTLVFAAMRRHYIEYGIGPREPFSIPLVREARRALMIDVTDAYVTRLKAYSYFDILKRYPPYTSC